MIAFLPFSPSREGGNRSPFIFAWNKFIQLNFKVIYDFIFLKIEMFSNASGALSSICGIKRIGSQRDNLNRSERVSE